ncbi:MAG: hypothetical protein QHH06_04635 [Clostridiales bacterium]|jgi:hypothetical protein|nr:hypothetical protein [Eubacteriales bacterium]MDH7565754.1 hypothetical protein [Clostridiales bacterium]
MNGQVILMCITEYSGVAMVPIIIGLGQIARNMGFPAKFLPLLNLFLGFAASFLFSYASDIKTVIIQGLFLGLGASGLYSGTKNVIEGIKEKKDMK